MLCEKTKDKIKEQIDDVLSNFKTEKVITLLGNWNITIDVPPKMNSRLEEHYTVVSCDNNNFDIYTSKVTDTGFEIGIIVSNISPPEYPEELTIHKDEIHSRISQIYERNNIYTADDTPKAYGNLYNI